MQCAKSTLSSVPSNEALTSRTALSPWSRCNVSATSRDAVPVTDIESHPPEAGPINSTTSPYVYYVAVAWRQLFLCILIPILKMRRTPSSTAPTISTMCYTTATFQRASTTVITPLAFVHASTPSFLHGSNSSTSTLSQPLPKDHRRRYPTSVPQHRAPPP
ncbi:hypothetical protein M422DRAFT_269702 [Sphaerobolus stellatus SS14]|uniref:Uncharacterized protein n=1 Tax=Sphaerobolus stellatus (strain SS14) TaxID=990650 RepID=A0A0C9U410_SPHS4|nr:hypothetical protein M422DRAFT_269702 [Sphaerobolus stellatus SS14]